MPNKTTSAHQFAGPVQYIAETTEGTIPTTGSTTVLSCKMLSIKKDGQFVDIGQLGTEDLLAIINGAKKPESQIKIVADAITFIKRSINSQNIGTIAGTISESFSLVVPIYLNNTVNYIVLKGCREKQIQINMEIGKDIEFTIDLVNTTIVKPTATPPTGLTLTTTFPTTSPYTWLTGGTGPITWNGTALNAKKCSVTINRNTTVDHTLGNEDPYSSLNHGRRITAEIMGLWTENTVETDHDAGTARTLVVTIDSTEAVLTISNAKVKTYNRDVDEADTEAAVENMTIGALTCALASA